MAALTPAAPDKVEVLANIETVLAWDLRGPAHPSVEDAMGMVAQFTEFGRIVAEDLRTQCLGIPADSGAGRSGHTILGEADRRLHASPPNPLSQQAATHRAQNLARLIQALNRATGEVGKEQAKTRSAEPRAPA
ncbi:DUF6415 family natural product biosynthesis protein [Streptomyces formicae]|uniref:Uncharacterized protein n=1 Tax=Streptomyces formicae TaxID=1616117 RepID=A0ABY3WKM6_9ACTN|nr:DUF6415 family natural product biosynthesis protein [Streptomyces formicae]UNM13141.1 hypothetical protein J4032_18035 [Streptomyces formicae]